MSEQVLNLGLWPVRSADSELDAEVSRESQLHAGSALQGISAREINGLVQQLFFAEPARAVRHVAISALDTSTDVRRLCRRVGETLATQTGSHVAVVSRAPQILHDPHRLGGQMRQDELKPLQKIATRARENLWILAGSVAQHSGGSLPALQSYLKELRREFQFAVVEENLAEQLRESIAVGRLLDGVVLVVSARHTRRAVACTLKERLEQAQVRILGTVVVDRTFPIPEAIYRRL